MIRLVKTEFIKYKRSPILWLGMLSVLFSILLAAFQLAGTNDSVISYAGLSEGVVWNHFSLFLPFTFTLLVGHSIDREYTEGTLKNILAIPVSKSDLLLSKIMAGYGLVIAEWGMSFFVTLLIAASMRCPDIGPLACAASMKQLFLVSTCCYIAVMPVILLFSRKPGRFLSGVAFAFFYGFCGIFMENWPLFSWYPMTTGLVLSGYMPEGEATYSPSGSLITLLLVAACSLALLKIQNRKHEEML